MGFNGKYSSPGGGGGSPQQRQKWSLLKIHNWLKQDLLRADDYV